jgi:chromosome segregation ATPase
MKVKVSVKTSPKVQNKYYEQVIAEAYAEMETMFQENKDLRVSEGHLRSDLACAQAQIEKLTAELAQVKNDASHAAFATGEILLEAERKAQQQEDLIAELNDQITASEADVKFWKKAAAENAELSEQNIAQVAAWERSAHEQDEQIQEQRKTIARIEAQLVAMGKKNDEIQHELTYWKSKAEEATAELVKYDIGHYQREIDEWKATADKLSERLRELQAAFADLQLEHQELGEDYDALVKTKCEYAEYIDTLRQEVRRLRNQMSLPEFMRQFIEMTREAVQNEFPDSGNS